MSKVIKDPVSGKEFWLETKYMLDNKYHSGKRTNPKARKYMVVHHTAGNTPGDLSVLRGQAGVRVSVKYLVPDPQDGNYLDDKGRLIIYQLLAHDVVGWSIGASTGEYAYVTNSTSDSIEVSNLGNGKDTFERSQVEAVKAIIALEEHRLSQELRIFAHFETAPGRKVDPYRAFPLQEVKNFAIYHTFKEVYMATTYRHVAGWAEDSLSRQKIVDECNSLGIRYTVDGPAWEFHAPLNKTKTVEAVVAAEPKLHRFNGVLVEAGTHSNMGVADGIGTKQWNVTVV